jgi:hypothetical protein
MVFVQNLKTLTRGLMAGLLVLSVPVFAQDAEQNASGIQVLDAGAVEAPLSASAVKMAELGVPIGPLLVSQKTINDRIFAISMERNPESAAVLRSEPGLSTSVRRAVDVTVLQVVKANYPNLVQDLAIHYDRAFTVDEQLELIRFFESKSGQALIMASLVPSDAIILKRLLDDDDGIITKDEAEVIYGDFRERALQKLSAEDKGNANIFFRTELGRKYSNSFDEEDRISLNWVNINNASLPPLAIEAVENAVINYINRGRK